MNAPVHQATLHATAVARVRTPVARKIIFLVLLFVAPLVGVTIYFLLKGPNKDIEFASMEKKGIVYLRPLERLLDAIPRHQIATGNAKLLADTEGEIDEAFTALQDAQTKVGGDLQFTVDGLAKAKRTSADPAAIKNLWMSVRAGQGAPAELAAKYDKLINAISDAIVHAGDKSNLILDPDLDSYYAMDVTLNTLPQVSRRLAALALLSREEATPEMRQKLAIFAAQLGDDLAAIRSKFESIYNEDANFYGSSASLRANTEVGLADAGRAVERLIEVLTASAAANEPDGLAILKATEIARTQLSQLWSKGEEELDVLLNKRIESLAQSRNFGIAITIGLLLVASFAAFFILRTITRPIGALSETVSQVAMGDESARAPVISRDEIGILATAFNSMVAERSAARQRLEEENKRLQASIQQLLVVVAEASDGNLGVRAQVTEGALGNVADALNLMFENVGDLIKSAKSVSNRVNAAASTITNAATDLTDGTVRQSDQLEGVAEGARDLTAEASAVANACREAAQAAAAAEAAADRGAKVVREVIAGMDQIRESVQVNGKKIKRLGERSMEIGGILRTINEISAQTDMLALNASIEAGRAGEAGRGFSAVAEQVRGLAERAKLATQQIEKLVSDIQQETAEAVAQVEGQTHQVEAGAQKVALAGEALNDIVQVAAQSRSAVTSISATAERQAAKTGKMLEAVSSVATIATESRSKVLGAQSTSEQLASLSRDLDKQLAQFQVEA